MTDLTGLLVLLIVAATLALMLVRPRGVTEVWVSAAGALAILAIRVVPTDAIPHVIGETSDVLLFLAGMMLLTGIAERAGVFEVLAEGCVRLARERGRVLFINLFVLGALVTATLSLDVTIIMLTPIVYALTSRRKLDALPFLFSCAFVANTASLVLPVSNLTNLLVYERFDMGFGNFVSVMWWPNLVAALTNLLVFLWIFRHRIPARFSATNRAEESLAIDRWTITNGTVVAGTLIAVFAFGLANKPLWWASIGGAGMLLVLAVIGGRIRIAQMVHDLSPSIFVFIVSMTVVVDGFQRTWLAGRAIPFPESVSGAAITGIAGGAIGSNIVNNVPMTVLALSLIEQAHPSVQTALAYGTLVGTNIGPAFTTYGSLATMIWLTSIRRHGIEVSTREYMKVSLITVPIVLVAAGATLLIVLATGGG
ncbi:MAG: SLC13 family permease [Thermomicrobiales bacterium]